MGASGWRYFTTYQPDINAALKALRQRVFESGEYESAEQTVSPKARNFNTTSADGTPSPQDFRALQLAMQASRQITTKQADSISSDLAKEYAEAAGYFMNSFRLSHEERVAARERLITVCTRIIEVRARSAKAKSIRDLLRDRRENGTHSILDIYNGVSSRRKFGAAFPMPDDIKLKEFGTLQPTREQIEAADML